VKARKITTRHLLLIVPVFLFSLILDRILILFNFPSEIPRYANPPNFHELRSSMEFKYIFETNDLGLRYKHIPLSKRPQDKRIYVAGDSFTEGFGVPADQTFSAELEKSFGGLSFFINGGLENTGPLEYGRAFIKLGMMYHPDALLLCIYPNDLDDTSESAIPSELYFIPPPKNRSWVKRFVHALWPRSYTLMKRILKRDEYSEWNLPSDVVHAISQKAMKRGIPPQEIEKWKNRLSRNIVDAVNKKALNPYILERGLLTPNLIKDALEIGTSQAEAKWRAMSAILSEIVRFARGHHVEVGLVFVPCNFQYDPQSHQPSNVYVQAGWIVRNEWLNGSTEIEKRLQRWSDLKKIPFLNLTPYFQQAESRSDFVFPIDGHWNAHGHRFAASVIQSWLAREKVFPFSK
jgi:hypothetical protein